MIGPTYDIQEEVAYTVAIHGQFIQFNSILFTNSLATQWQKYVDCFEKSLISNKIILRGHSFYRVFHLPYCSICAAI